MTLNSYMVFLLPLPITALVFGQFIATLTHGAKETKEVIFVVSNLQKSLLGHPGIEVLDLVSRIDTLREVCCYVSKAFQRLGIT